MRWRADHRKSKRCGRGCRTWSFPLLRHRPPNAPRRGSGPPVEPLLVVLAVGRLAVRLLLDLIEDRRILQSRDISELVSVGDVSEQPPHDLSRTRLGKIVGEDDRLWPCDLADGLANMLPQFFR